MLGLGLGTGEGAVRGGGGPLAFLGPRLIALWDAGRADSLTVANGAVAAWRDLKSGHVVQQAAAQARPAYSPVAIGGRAGLMFDGNDDCLEMTGVPFGAGAAPCEIWAVASCTADPAAGTSGRNIIAWGSEVNTSRRLRRTVAGGINRAQGVIGTGSAAIIPSNLAIDLTGAHVVRLVIDGSSAAVQVDGVMAGSANAVPATGTLNLRIGAQEGASMGSYWQGAICLVAITQILTTRQSSQLDRHLRRRIAAS